MWPGHSRISAPAGSSRPAGGWPPWRRRIRAPWAAPSITCWGSARRPSAATKSRSRLSPACPRASSSPRLACISKPGATSVAAGSGPPRRASKDRSQRAGPDRDRLVNLLVRVFEMQARFDDVRRLLRAQLEESAEPLKVLRRIDNIDLGGHPYVGLRRPWSEAGRLAPDDDRVWLGRGGVAIAGRPVGRGRRLARALPGARADAPVWRAWLDWARGSGRPDEVVRVLGHLGPGDLDPAERLEARAWLRSAARRSRGGATGPGAMAAR